MKILHGGPGFRWSTTEGRRRALVALGHDVHAIDVQEFVDPSTHFVPKVKRHLNIGRGVAAYNEALVRAARALRPELIWLDLPIQVWSRTVEELRSFGAPVVSRHSEYVRHRAYWYRHLLRATPIYDAHIVTNKLTAGILQTRGARRIVIGDFSYDPELHRPLSLTPAEVAEYGTDAVFVGHWEPGTEGRINKLRRSGVRVSVHGPNWHRAVRLKGRRRMAPIWGDSYVKALVGAKICLGFLSRWNRNEATPRTFEIPATGSFLLGDRTPSQLTYFVEGMEAEFFSSDDEMVEKCQYYLSNDEARQKVARAGRLRCVKSEHTHEDQVRRELSELLTDGNSLAIRHS